MSLQSSNTGNAQMSRAEVERIVAEMSRKSGGNHLSIGDPRVTKANDWLIGAIGLALISMLGWLLVSVAELNSKMATVIQQNAYGQQTDEAQNKRFDNYEERLRAIERGRR